MLAYVFWHWSREGVAREDYESRLLTFHEELKRVTVAGFQRSLVWRINGAPWLPAGTAYEDWYLMDDSAALDALTTGATAGTVATLHRLVAQLAEGGTAGLYNPTLVDIAGAAGSTALWFSKPTGMGYSAFFSSLKEAAPGTSDRTWMRMLTLGPTPELCLLLDEPIELPAEWQASPVQREQLWGV